MNQVEVCNLALGWLGAKSITSIDDASTEAELCKANWVPARDVCLESREWSFAIQRLGPLAAAVAAPVYDFTKKYVIPSTVLRVLNVQGQYGDEVDNWQREGQYIVCYDDAIYMRALVRVEDTSAFPASFCHALAARIAADIAIAVNNSTTQQETLWKLWVMKMKEATVLDSMQGRTLRIKSPALMRYR